MKRRSYLLLVLSLSSACTRCDTEKQTTVPASATASAAPSASAPPVVDDVQPVYPRTNAPPDPLAKKLCEALHDVPAKRRGTCCSHPPSFSLASECTRTLSQALHDKAAVVEVTAVDTCVSAMNAAHDGCTWVGPTNVRIPSACDGIVRGTLQEGKKCRSSLECSSGLRCLGVGPTDAGVCRKPLSKGYPCGVSVDTLAALVRQDGFEKLHPECVGYCAHHRCQEIVALHGACKTNLECGFDAICADGKCEQGALPGDGKTCAVGACADGFFCDAGTCRARRGDGAACTNDRECIGGCVRANGGRNGTCGMKCRML